MPTGTLVSVEEYLRTGYRPDREYIDGVIEERNLGEFDHARVQGIICGFFYAREKEWNVLAIPELRVQVKPTRFRVPDVSIVVGRGPFEQILTTPPFICIEILSKE